MHRIFAANTDFSQDLILIQASDEIHHVLNVLKLKPGETIGLFNGKGREAQGRLLHADRKKLSIQILCVQDHARNRPLISLACAIPKKAKFETIIEKTTELGVDEIIPLITQRTEVRYTEEQAANKTERFNSVAVNAAKQCRRTVIPRIYPPEKLSKFFEKICPPQGLASIIYIPCLRGLRLELIQAFPPGPVFPQRFIFLIGPEGDFTPGEIEGAVKNGSIPVSLGPTTLKVDTAAISVVAFTNFYLCHRDSPKTSSNPFSGVSLQS